MGVEKCVNEEQNNSLDTGYRKDKKTVAICQHTRRECARQQEVPMSRTRVQH